MNTASPPFAIDYIVQEHGWASVAFQGLDWPAETRYPVSDLHDVLPELVRAACDALSVPNHGRISHRISFWDEPGELVLSLSAAPTADQVIVQLDEWAAWGDAEDGRPAVRSFGSRSMSRLAFARAVAECLQAVRAAHALADYEARWNHPFPVELHDQLQRLLKAAHTQRKWRP